MEWLTVLVQVFTVLAVVYYYISSKHNFWTKRGVNGPPPTFLFGNIVSILRHGQAATELEWYRKYGKVYGNYLGLMPALTVNSPELIKQVLVKDFHLFINRRKVNFQHEIWSHNLFFSEAEAWKKVRTITSPTFTSGKLKGMNRMMDKCIRRLGTYLEKISSTSGGVIDTKEVMASFTIEVIASTSFATETSAIDVNSTTKSPFVHHGLNMFKPNPGRLLSLFTMPLWFNNLLKFHYAFPDESFAFFRNLVETIVDQRKANCGGGAGQKRSDLVQLLIDAYVYENELQGEGDYDKLTADMEKDDLKETISNGPVEGTKRGLSKNEIIANLILFFVAGFETTASTISHCAYEMAMNPEVQERLYEELTSALEGIEPDSDQYYETVTTHIHYLDAVIKETLRKYPPVTRLDRTLTGDHYKLAGIELQKGQLVQISTYAVHHSDEFYPEPERFNPDRFMPENRHFLTPYTYLPFGQGPRNCVGMRFAYQEIKLCLAKIVPQFKFLRTPQTPVPLQFNKTGLLLSAKSFPLKVERR